MAPACERSGASLKSCGDVYDVALEDEDEATDEEDLDRVGEVASEAPVRSGTGAMTSKQPQCAPAQGPCLQRGLSAVLHRCQDFKEVPVWSRTGAISTKRP